MKNNWESELKSILDKPELGGWEIISQVYDLIVRNEDNAPKVLKRFFELSEVMSIDCSTRSHNRYTKAKEDELLRKYSKCGFFEKVDELFSQNTEVEEFYSNLWKLIKSYPDIASKKERVFMTFSVWQNPRIPYFQLPQGMKMSNDEFREIWDDIQETLTQARFVIFSRFEQRSEEASVLLDLLNQCNTKKKKAVLLAVIISLVEARQQLELNDK